MTEAQYWHGDPYLTVAYREAEQIKRQDDSNRMWLQGAYIHEAFAVVMSNAFRKKGQQAVKYSKEPYRVTPPTKEEKAERAEAERQKAIKSLNAWKSAWDTVHNERQSTT